MSAQYDQAIDREFAYEVLARRAAPTPTAGGAPGEERSGGFMDGLNDVLFGSTGPRGGKRDGVVQPVVKSTARSIAREMAWGILGSLLGSKSRR